MKLAGTVILYHPDDSIFKNVQSYLHHIEKLYVIDNTENDPAKVAKNILQLPKVTYLHNGINNGIAARLNQVCNLAIKHGYEWLLTMNQDYSFEDDFLEKYIQCIAKFADREKVSMFGINYLEKVNQKNGCNALAVDHLITSGSIINLKLFTTIGGFDEKLFIDEVDLEYCFNSMAKGFKIIQFSNIYLTHSLGKLYYHRSLKNLKTTPRILHSPVRLYYITRNFFYIRSKYKHIFPEQVKRIKAALLNRIKNNLLYNKKRMQVIKYIIKAILDYNNNKMGKL